MPLKVVTLGIWDLSPAFEIFEADFFGWALCQLS